MLHVLLIWLHWVKIRNFLVACSFKKMGRFCRLLTISSKVMFFISLPVSEGKWRFQKCISQSTTPEIFFIQYTCNVASSYSLFSFVSGIFVFSKDYALFSLSISSTAASSLFPIYYTLPSSILFCLFFFFEQKSTLKVTTVETNNSFLQFGLYCFDKL